MNFTTFNTRLSHLTSFDTIGYDKDNQTLKIRFFNGNSKDYYSVPEELIFKLLISEDKEAFVANEIQSKYSNKTNLIAPSS